MIKKQGKGNEKNASEHISRVCTVVHCAVLEAIS